MQMLEWTPQGLKQPVIRKKQIMLKMTSSAEVTPKVDRRGVHLAPIYIKLRKKPLGQKRDTNTQKRTPAPQESQPRSVFSKEHHPHLENCRHHPYLPS